MILLKNQSGFWVKDNISVGNAYSVFSITYINNASAAHWNKAIATNPDANSWIYTSVALNITQDVIDATNYDWHSLNNSWINDSNDSTGRCKVASKGLEIS